MSEHIKLFQYKCDECGGLSALYTEPVAEYAQGWTCGTCAGTHEDSNYSRQGGSDGKSSV